jgi:hypothetical protein
VVVLDLEQLAEEGRREEEKGAPLVKRREGSGADEDEVGDDDVVMREERTDRGDLDRDFDDLNEDPLFAKLRVIKPYLEVVLDEVASRKDDEVNTDHRVYYVIESRVIQ